MESPVSPIKIIIAEDEDLYRDLLQNVLKQDDTLQVVGTYKDGETCVAEGSALRPDVALLDVELSGQLTGIQVGLMLRRLCPSIGIVLLTNHKDPSLIMSVPKRDVAGWSYLLKQSVSDVEMLKRAILGSTEGYVVLDHELFSGVVEPKKESSLNKLTPRQLEVLSLLAQGHVNASIAEHLSISEKTVENHINAIYQALGIDSYSPYHPRVTAVLRFINDSKTAR